MLFDYRDVVLIVCYFQKNILMYLPILKIKIKIKKKKYNILMTIWVDNKIDRNAMSKHLINF